MINQPLLIGLMALYVLHTTRNLAVSAVARCK